jgi:hypothetical protein
MFSQLNRPPRLYPCLRFTASLAVAAQDSGPSGSLVLSRKNFAFSASKESSADSQWTLPRAQPTSLRWRCKMWLGTQVPPFQAFPEPLLPRWSKRVPPQQPQVDESNEREFAFGGGHAGIPCGTGWNSSPVQHPLLQSGWHCPGGARAGLQTSNDPGPLPSSPGGMYRASSSSDLHVMARVPYFTLSDTGLPK